MRRLLLCLLLGLPALPMAAQQQPPPPAPYNLTGEERRELQAREEQLQERLRSLKLEKEKAADAVVFLHIARMADELNLYTRKEDVAEVMRGLDIGLARCDALAAGMSPWKTDPGRHLRGYLSKIDGSVQPYGVTLPAGYLHGSGRAARLDVVLHGRGPTEITFLRQQEPKPGTRGAEPPQQAFITFEPFGRGNNGWRWAGESDVFEALEQVRTDYKIDPNRVVLRGFSMGGHGAWHLSMHYPGEWCSASPGAGFTDTRRYLKITTPVPPREEAAWRIYDAVDYAPNLFNIPVVGYGGEDDPQLQATLNMKEAAEKAGVPLSILIGPKTAHAYHPATFDEIMRQLARHTRNPQREQVQFTTYTLKYNRCHWVAIDALDEHYKKATVRADCTGSAVEVTTENVRALTLDVLPRPRFSLRIDGQELKIKPLEAVHLVRTDGKWRTIARPLREGKMPGIQGPIDDAFTSPFLVVKPSGSGWSPMVRQYTEQALATFKREWRIGFRGELVATPDIEVPDRAFGHVNLILFGDPASNTIIKRMISRLPIKWTAAGLEVNGKKYSPDHVPVLVFPNPFLRVPGMPRRYVVINSGHTFTEADLVRSNAYLTPKLADWAVLLPKPGKEAGRLDAEVVDSDFFDEEWKFRRPAVASKARP